MCTENEVGINRWSPLSLLQLFGCVVGGAWEINACPRIVQCHCVKCLFLCNAGYCLHGSITAADLVASS